MRQVSFDVTQEDRDLIAKIVARTAALAKAEGLPRVDKMSLTMDLTACHANGTPLRLADLLAADDGNFGHDVFGIRRFLDRETGQLTGHFLPRYAAPTASAIGRKGGAAKTPAKAQASRANGRKGGRPGMGSAK